MAENNLSHTVRCKSTKPPYAERHVRWCGRPVNVKVGGKCLLWITFTSYPIWDFISTKALVPVHLYRRICISFLIVVFLFYVFVKAESIGIGEAILLLSFNPISLFLNGRRDIIISLKETIEYGILFSFIIILWCNDALMDMSGFTSKGSHYHKAYWWKTE